MSLILSGTNGLSDVDGSAATPAIRGTDANTGIFFPAADTIAFAEGGVEAMRLDASGNLGLGVTPSAWGTDFTAMQIGAGGNVWGLKADVTELGIGSNYRYDLADGRFEYIGTGLASMYTPSKGKHVWYTAPSGTAGNAISFTQAMTLDASGRLLVGFTSAFDANSKLQVSGSGISLKNDYAGANNNWSNIRNTATSGQSNIYFESGNGNMTFDHVGNLLVGDTTAAAKLWAYKTDAGNTFGARATFATYSSTVSFFGADRNTTDNSFYYIDCYNYGSSSYRFRVADSGNVTNTNNSYGAISDAKLKENVTDATPKLEKLNQVRVVNFNMIGSEQKQLGVIAQELEQIFPGMVDESPDRDKDGNDLGTTTKSVKYSVFVPMLIKAMQEQQAIIAQLQADVATLKGAA